MRSLLPVVPVVPLLAVILCACDDAAPVASDQVWPPPLSAPAVASSMAEVPPVPVYDLAFEVRARTEFARIDLGNGMDPQVVGDVFLMVSRFRGKVFDDSVAVAQQALAAYFNGRFAKHPEHAVTIYVFDRADEFRQYCEARGGGDCKYGVYLPGSREILANQASGVTTLAHELVHPLIADDFPHAPVWLNEGIAAVFEAPVFPHPGEIHGTTNWRLPRLTQAFGSEEDRKFVRLDNLFLLSGDAFKGGAADLAYALARYACMWLDSKNQLWPFYQAWRDHVADDPSGEKAFAAVVGRTPKEANADWEKWVRAL
jgi:hypothetical protein